jgi:uncharacterized membrane protein YGL010W
MKPLEEQMSFYGAYHRDGRNRATHFVGVPVIIFALLVALGWLRMNVGGVSLSAAMLFVLIVHAYYFRLDLALAAAMAIVTLVLLYFSEQAAQLPFARSLAIFVISFIGGWVLQLIGHYFEGRKPALLDNFLQIFVAPLFLMAEVFFALGWKPALRARVEQLVEARVQKRGDRPMSDAEMAT